VIKRVLPASAKKWLKRRLGWPDLEFGTPSYAQEGEDILLRRMLLDRDSGFYVDVGAHHPLRYSNTHLFYRLGWRGINIEPRPGSKALFDTFRPRDTNLELAIGPTLGKQIYYEYHDSAFNTFDVEEWRARMEQGIHPSRAVALPMMPLRSVLDRYLPVGMRITILSVDVEGLDLTVLKSNDWSRYRPEFIVAEDLAARSLHDALDSALVQYLAGEGYRLNSRLLCSLLFRNARS
jgi:hypothetical protein